MEQQTQHFGNFMLRYFVKSCIVFISNKNCLVVRFCVITNFKRTVLPPFIPVLVSDFKDSFKDTIYYKTFTGNS